MPTKTRPSRSKPTGRFCRWCAIAILLLVSLGGTSCGPANNVVLDDDELFELASIKLRQSQEGSPQWKISHPKQRKQAMGLLDQLLSQYPESRHAEDAQMLIADLYFEDKKFEEADAEYTVYLRFYPSTKRAQKAQFRLALTHRRRMAEYDRDQSETHKTLEACERYYTLYSEGELTPLVSVVERESLATLADHEFYVGRFYYRRHLYSAASARLKVVLSDYPDSPAASKALLYLAKIDLKSERPDDAIAKLEQLIREHPGSRYVKKAERLLEETRR